MVARVLVRPPTRPSAGAQVLREGLGNIARLSRRDPVPRQYRHVINWGNPTDVSTTARLYNNPEAVRVAIDKLATFHKFQEAGVPAPPFQTEPPTVDRGVWLARTTLRGSGGDGIIPVRRGDTVPNAPLYVRYVPKLHEYRLHAVGGKVVFAQQKRRMLEADQTADQRLIRNHANGWVFAIENVNVPEQLSDAAIKAVEALGLDFGAVDGIVGKKDGLPYILEVNTAPGIQSPTLKEAYLNAFKELLNV